MKTPEEIKKAFECCKQTSGCTECPYNEGRLGYRCLERRNTDALALIHRLEKENADLLEERELNDYLRDEVKKLKAERDALAEGVHKIYRLAISFPLPKQKEE